VIFYVYIYIYVMVEKFLSEALFIPHIVADTPPSIGSYHPITIFMLKTYRNNVLPISNMGV